MVSDVHRGFLLSLSASKKNHMCRDFFYAQLYKEAHPSDTEDQISPLVSIEDVSNRMVDTSESSITDGVTTKGAPQHPLLVIKVWPNNDSEHEIEDLIFTCVGKNFPYRAVGSHHELHISSAFRPSWLFGVFPGNQEYARYVLVIGLEKLDL